MRGIVDHSVVILVHFERWVVTGVGCEVRAEDGRASATEQATFQQPVGEFLVFDLKLLVGAVHGLTIHIHHHEVNVLV